MTVQKGSERGNSIDGANALIGRDVKICEGAKVSGIYVATCMRVVEEYKDKAVALLDRIETLKKESPGWRFWRKFGIEKLLEKYQADYDAIPRYPVWQDEFAPNAVTNVGANYLLDNGMAGSSYTAAFYLGLISSTSYTGVNVTDTMSSHGGWLEAGLANAPTYSQSARPTAAWSAAASRSKSLSSALAFSITGTGTIKGCFLTTVATKDGTTGTMYSSGTFTGGDKSVVSTDTVNVSYTTSV